MTQTSDAWDALPPAEVIGEATYDPTPEAAALRALFGASAFKILGNTSCRNGDRELDGAQAVQEHIAGAYLFAIEAHKAKPVERCLFCGTAVTPGALIGNMLANGAMPKMAEQTFKAMRPYTDELGALRKRVAELEALHEAAEPAIAALESIGEQARERIAALEAMLDRRDALVQPADAGRPAVTPDKATAEIYLITAALGFAAHVTDGDRDAHAGARQFLVTTALAYAGATGKLDAAERAEIEALRRFRDGVVSLRGEIADARRLSGDAHDGALAEAVETIDALLAISYPAIGAR